MLKQLLTRGLAACLLTLSLQSAFSQAPFWTETFSVQASATANWINGGTNAGPEDWTWTDDPTAGFVGLPTEFASPTVSTGYFYFNSDANSPDGGNGNYNIHDAKLTGVGAPANCSGKTDVHLRFATQYAYAFEDGSVAAELGVSTNGVDFTYKPLFAGVPSNADFNDVVDVDLDEADGQAQVWLQLRWRGTWEYHWKVDDLELYEYVAPTHNVTFQVNMITTPVVDPGGVRIAGSFNGWTDELMTTTGNGIWSITKTLDEGATYQYKFKNGPNGWEPGQAACGVDDGNGGFNRTLTVGGADAVLTAVCFNSCTPCTGVPCTANPDAIICDNFETYNVALKLGPQSTNWTTWSGVEGNNEDGIVSTEQASSPTKSLKVTGTAVAGVQQDVVLNLGNKTTGNYELKWKMYFPAGKEGYYNFQSAVPLVGGAGDWGLDIFYGANGKGFAGRAVGTVIDTMFKFTYANGAWLDIKHTIDLDNNIIAFYINDVLKGKTAYVKNLGGIDFFGVNTLNQFYVDDVEYIKLPTATFNADECPTAYDLTGLFGLANGVISTSPIQDNTNSTTSATDPTDGNECFFGTDGFQQTNYYTFVGDGSTYTISSKACGGAPIDDTQFALYSGVCGTLTPIACNDDIDAAAQNFYSTLLVNTQVGVTYYMIVDGWSNGTVTAEGTYCIDVVKGESITCADAQLGAFALANNGVVCWGGVLGDILELDETTWTIPNQGPVGGVTWAWTAAPLDPNVWPGVPSGLVTVSPPSTQSILPFTLNLPNDGSQTFAQPGTYYLTPVIVAGATQDNPAGSTQLWNLLEPVDGCYFIGESIQVNFVPEVQPLAGFSTTSPGVGGNVDIELTVAGGYPQEVGDPNIADYIYQWSPNVSDGAFAVNVANVNYTVTVSDPTGCTDEIVIDITSGTTDPSSVKGFTISPNPTSGLINVNLTLEAAADVQLEIVNTLGQTMQVIKAGRVANLIQPIDLGQFATGNYTIRVRMDNETAVRRVIVQK